MLQRRNGATVGGSRPSSHASYGLSALVHAGDDGPGIRRRRAGKGFSYASAKGDRVTDAATLDRIKALAIPPAWTDVWIAPRAEGHIQATGRDIRGRKQYRYHALWSARRDEVKFSSLGAFADALPKLRATVDRDLRRQDMTRERAVASIVWLLDNTMIRVGNAAYARDNKSFGLSTLKSRHVKVVNDTLRFSFKGKSGKEWRIRLVDRRMAKVIRSIQDLSGQQLFQYIDEDGERHDVTSQDVNAYIRDAGGADFTSKHFRTWDATVSAASILSETPLPETKAGQASSLNVAIDEVAARLGNTRTVCRKCYIHPRVMDRWTAGKLATELAAAKRTVRKRIEGLDENEAVVRAWLARA